MKPASSAPTYAVMYPDLSQIANEHGYALAIHGSLQRDFDLIACPWTDEASDHETLAAAFRARICWALYPKDHPMMSPGIKPHGRLAWTFPMMGDSFIDLSIMPRQPQA